MTTLSLYFYQSDGNDPFAVKRKITVDDSLFNTVLSILIKDGYSDIEVLKE